MASFSSVLVGLRLCIGCVALGSCVAQLYRRRRSVQNEIEGGNYSFAFLPDTRHVREVRACEYPARWDQ